MLSDLSPPPLLYEVGLESAVKWVATRFCERHGIVCEFTDDGQPKPLSRDIRTTPYQAIHELLRNVTKHAKARRVRITLSRDDDVVRGQIEDDGVGFDITQLSGTPDAPNGFGLMSIGERLDRLGGHLHIDSEPGGGTRVTLTAPVQTGEPHSRRDLGTTAEVSDTELREDRPV